MKKVLIFLNKTIFMSLILNSFASYSQTVIPDIKPADYNYQQHSPNQEIPVQVAPLQGGGVQRVGSAPIPVTNQTLEIMNAPSVTLQRPQGVAVQPVIMPPRKLPYESTFMTGRIIYLNGVNINSVKNQELDNVNLKIDGSGNIYIDAPHYDISVEQSYHPLMPGELPKFQKTEYIEPNLPKGTYSKETGKLINNEDKQSPIFSKEFSSKVPLKDQAPYKEKTTNQPPADADEKNTNSDNAATDTNSKDKAAKNE